jgi:hypothetical protein
MIGHHVGLRAEALQELARTGIPISEAAAREQREKAREWCDEEAVALWSQVIWRHYARSRYVLRQKPRSLALVAERVWGLLSGASLQDEPVEHPAQLEKHSLGPCSGDAVDAPVVEES